MHGLPRRSASCAGGPSASTATTIAILANPLDIHAFAVAEGLHRMGAEAVLVHTSDFPRALHATIDPQRARVAIRGQGIELGSDRIGVVWNRRPRWPVLPDWTAAEDRAFAANEARDFVQALSQILSCSAFWVNPPLARQLANLKPWQHACAAQVGLTTPETIYSNDPREVRAFVRAHPGCVYKTHTQTAAWAGDRGSAVTYTSRIGEDDLADERLIESPPGIYQALVEKAHELRVTVIGKRAFTARIDSQASGRGRLDWRLAHDQVRYQADELPAAVLERCLALMRRLDLVFGCFDLIVTPAGEHVFLEVNEMGQFLWLEDAAGLPLLDAFCAFLAQGTIDFAWDPARASLRFADVRAAAEQAMARAQREHPPLGEGMQRE